MLSPYIRHNLLTLGEVHDAVQDAPFKDREKFRDELYWQEYARHLYARIGVRLFENLRFSANSVAKGNGWLRIGLSEMRWAGCTARSECTES